MPRQYDSVVRFQVRKRSDVGVGLVQIGTFFEKKEFSEALYYFSVFLICVFHVVHTLVDAVLQEEAQVAHSRTKWETYYKNVAYKFIPKVY